jgi:hypothetical protein
MDGNRTHPGRLNSAPQTVLKTAGHAYTTLHGCTPYAKREGSDSAPVRHCPCSSADLAVISAVNERPWDS